jgi:hypothetical protein
MRSFLSPEALLLDWPTLAELSGLSALSSTAGEIERVLGHQLGVDMRLILLAVLVASGCQAIRPVTFGADSARGQSLSNRTEAAEKVVNMKRQPWTFVAKDGSRCEVDEQTWRDTRVGEKATCLWEFTGKR